MTVPLRWRKSRSSQNTTNCVELAPVEDGVLVRDSKNPKGPILSVNLGALLAAAKSTPTVH